MGAITSHFASPCQGWAIRMACDIVPARPEPVVSRCPPGQTIAPECRIDRRATPYVRQDASIILARRGRLKPSSGATTCSRRSRSPSRRRRRGSHPVVLPSLSRLQGARLLPPAQVLPCLRGGRLTVAALAVPSDPSPDGTNSLDRSQSNVLYLQQTERRLRLGGLQCRTYGPRTPSSMATPSPGPGVPS
jgi:hypothetical protein